MPSLPQPWRKTPLIHSALLSKHAGCQIYLKLENLQPSGSFKSRGIGYFMQSHPSTSPPAKPTHFYSSSGGNAGLACVHAAVTLKSLATIVVPMSTTPYMISKIRAAGATEVIQHGSSWVEADSFLRETVIPGARARGEDAVYVPPFDDSRVWDGHATMVEEIFEQLGSGVKAPDALVCSVGGGGLFSGIMRGLERAKYPDLQVLAVETEGADSLALSLKEGKLSTLPAITSIATSLGARTVAAQAFAYAQRDSVRSVVFSDDVAKEGCVRFAHDERIMVEPACGVSLALCYEGRLRKILPHLNEESKVVITVCGGSNISTQMLGDWARSLNIP
ncbi:tryptophan synthase beta subunit-like PLP-dependent enzyme [Plenodomus tracheiphilus IPT5]|uniref:L-serine ammonia-lyase n=1 Tax=Plenodomus tracheiphilus IPT5 TaxID=1408161 RepID=A0A6A7AV05_9PLEO|nr:tryptophan synthase beta subunit-like PLP-dependent enzyme [Plenodomus tracheiphilus IPT5]